MSLRSRRTISNQSATSPGQVAAVMAGTVPATPAVATVPDAPLGAPAVPQAAPAVQALSSLAPAPASTGAVSNPYAALVPPTPSPAPSITAPGPVEVAVASTHELGVPTSITPPPSASSALSEKALVDLVGTVATIEKTLADIKGTVDTLVARVNQCKNIGTSLSTELAKSNAALQSVILNAIQTLKVAPAPAASTPPPQSLTPVAPPTAVVPTPQPPAQPLAPGSGSQVDARKQQIANAISVSVAKHYQNPSAMPIMANFKDHLAFLVVAAVGAGVDFQTTAAEPSLDPVVCSEVYQALEACGKIAPDGKVLA